MNMLRRLYRQDQTKTGKWPSLWRGEGSRTAVRVTPSGARKHVANAQALPMLFRHSDKFSDGVGQVFVLLPDHGQFHVYCRFVEGDGFNIFIGNLAANFTWQ